ncbi:MAG: 2,3-dihydro-2,3-dihydroxybenzoate dehydrogenase [Syntrophorhabdus sp. PtaU1.Bin153]|nr:MAG: 2,3-dihydro-2,3-dihydroxybenzoate dehydrogenase [Syntrophorhabdus sp. PtaU1.Bin153]
MSTNQKPINSGFTSSSTTADVIQGIDLHGKTAIVTGGSSGLGRETVRTFLAAGARVIVPARDLERARRQLSEIKGVEVLKMDLLSPASVDAFANEFLARNEPLHILVNSAGIMACPFSKSSRGFESQFATNHLGHFQLVVQLWPALLKAKGARVVSVASKGHWFSPIVFEDPTFDHRPYDPWAAYGQSKTANILLVVELDKRGKDKNIRAFALHPGGIPGTGLEKYVPAEQIQAAGIIDKDGKPILDPEKDVKTVEQGAATQVWCATSPKLKDLGGVYCENVEVAPIVDESPRDDFGIDRSAKTRGVRPYAIDPINASRLWELSEKLLGIKADI